MLTLSLALLTLTAMTSLVEGRDTCHLRESWVVLSGDRLLLDVVLSPTILGHNFTFEAQSGDDMFNMVMVQELGMDETLRVALSLCDGNYFMPSPISTRKESFNIILEYVEDHLDVTFYVNKVKGTYENCKVKGVDYGVNEINLDGPGQIKTCFVVRQLQNDASRAAAKSASVVAALALALLALALIGIAFLVMKNRKLRERSAAQNRSCPDGAAEAEQGGGGLREDALGPAGTRVEGMHAVIKPSVAKTRPGGPNNPAGVPWEGLPLNLRKLNFGSLRPGLGLGTRVWSRCAYVRREGAASVRNARPSANDVILLDASDS
ncbi:uncharacterized protein LOC143026834 [Oratosquilla oratoria]|uniref:uncharacterized protein LOC143026834 n=1 Tax=Oratosquilla oratoria TaxID=337810 RepID=UPI003F76464D